jgi:hypothetical protein
MFGTAEGMKDPPSSQKQAKCNLSQDSSKDLLACFMWVVKNVEPGVLKQWWVELTGDRLMSVCEVLRLTISSFQYKGRKSGRRGMHRSSIKGGNSAAEAKAHLEDMILGRPNAKEMLSRGSSRKGGGHNSPNPETRRWNNRHSFASNRLIPPNTLEATRSVPGGAAPACWGEVEEDQVIEGNLCTEVSVVVLDTLSIVEQVVSQSDQSQTLLASVLRVILHAFNTHQSTQTLFHLFAMQRSLVSKYPNLLFDETTEHCAALCKSLLKHCSSSISSIRSQSSASL